MYNIHTRPTVTDPIMVMHLRGWIDAGSCASLAMDLISGQISASPVASFDDDDLIDYRSRRPMIHLDDGLLSELEWPSIEVRHAADELGNDIFILTGAEPDRHWRAFAAAVTELCGEFGIETIVGLGAFPAPVPHTRQTTVVCTASSRQLADRIGHNNVKMEVPAGVQAAIEIAAAAEGMDAATLWAPIPHYAATMDYPAGAVALIDSLIDLTHIDVDASTLRDSATASIERLDELVNANPQHIEMLEALEHHVDDLAAARDTHVPSGEELAAQFRQFLEEQGG